MSGVDAPAPWRIAFDNARDPYTARNALGAEKIGGGGGGGGGAPDNAEYIVAATDATLTAERVLTDTASITWDFTTPGQAKASTTAGGGNVSNSGTPTLGQYAKWVTATTIQGVNAATVLGDIGAQPAGSYQPLDATLTALAAYNTNGLITQTAADTFTGRTLTGPAAGITVSNGNGVAGNPTLALADDLAALETLTGTNTIYYRSGTSVWTAVTVSTGLSFTGGVLTATAGGGNVSNSGTPVANDVAQWVTATTIKGVALSVWRTTATFYGTTSFRSTSALPANGFDIIPAVTGGTPSIDAVGIDTNISLAIKGKGNGVIDFYGQGVRQAQVGNVAGASTYLRLRGAVGQAIIDAVGGGMVNIIDANLTGSPIAPTPSPGDNDTSVATTAFVTAAIAAAGGGSASLMPPQGRLTLQTATPVMTTTQAAKTSIFYTPYVGNQVPIWNGSTMTPTSFTELTNVTTASSVGSAGPAAVAASSVYDLFVWSNAGTVTLTRGPAWTNDTTRSAGTALTMVNGIWLNNASITNGPAASRGTYVGTVRSNASSQVDWQFGTAAGVQGWFGVWNCYNRVQVVSTTAEPTSSWSYGSGTYRPLNNNAAIRASAVFGLSDESADALAQVQVDVPGGVGAFVGIGLDTTSANPDGLFGNTSNGIRNVLSARHHTNQFGFHFWQVLEATTGGSASFLGTSAGSWLSGIIFTARM